MKPEKINEFMSSEELIRLAVKQAEACELQLQKEYAIKELEKIKAEIEQDAFKDVNGSKYIFVNRVNQIIDKYKAELKGEQE